MSKENNEKEDKEESSDQEKHQVSIKPTKKKIRHKEERFYDKGPKSRQRYRLNNHAATTGFIIGLLSRYFHLIVSFPVKLTTICVNFPRLRTLCINDEEDIDISTIIRERTQAIKLEKLKENPKVNLRLNYITHYEIYHFVSDLMYLIDDYEMTGEREEPSGLSGAFTIRLGERIYEWEEIYEKGEEAIKRMYADRKEGEQRRMIKKGMLSDLFI